MDINKFFLSNFIQQQTIHNKSFVLGYYVYTWTDNHQPFYVGMGTNRRAWNQHLPSPEKRKEQAQQRNAFWVNILSHALTKEQAHTIERQYQIEYTKRGIVLLNSRIPTLGRTYAHFNTQSVRRHLNSTSRRTNN